MEKLDFHEFMRIYLPGLFLTIVISYFIKGSDLDWGAIAAIAIFVGLAYSWPVSFLSQKYFKLLVKKKQLKIDGKIDTYHNLIRHLRAKSYRLEGNTVKADEILNKTDDEIRELAYQHYAKRYNSQEIYSFRLPKSFGVLYFKLCFAIALAAIMAVILKYSGFLGDYKSFLGYFVADLSLMALFSFLFFSASRKYFINSLELELHYWMPPL